MEVIDVFLEKSKDKFLNSIVKIPKEYDWYLGVVVKTESDDLSTTVELAERCEEIYEKSGKHLELLKMCLLDEYTLFLFGTDPIPLNSNIKGIIKSICRYLDCKMYDLTYVKYFRDMIFDVWGEQKYFYLIDDNKVAYDLRCLKE
jgi:hypothetical protein